MQYRCDGELAGLSGFAPPQSETGPGGEPNVFGVKLGSRGEKSRIYRRKASLATRTGSRVQVVGTVNL
jgi:hypothetical protein